MASRSICWFLACICLACCTSCTTAATGTVDNQPQQQWSPQLETAVAALITKRRTNEATARLLDDRLDAIDVSLLTDEELDFSPVNLVAQRVSFPREPSSDWTQKVISAEQPQYRYFFLSKRNATAPAAAQDLNVDTSYAAPNIAVDLSDPLHPIITIPKVFGPDGNEALYYFEFDTSPQFDSPNFWQYPALMPSTDPTVQDLTGRDGLSFNISNARQRDVDGHENQIRFPFRSSAMRLPDDWSALSFEELESHALAIAYGLHASDAIAEIYRYGRHTWIWGNDTRDRNAIGVFRAGIGECNAINSLIGAILEMNGYRVRVVSGFNPKFRTVRRAGGHSAIEVRDPATKEWSYVDSYLDVLFLGMSAAELSTGHDADSALPMAHIDRPDWQKIFGHDLTLQGLFKYMTYGDTLSRLPMTSRLRLIAGPGVDAYGTTWELNTVAARTAEKLFQNTRTIYVRARYVFAGASRIQSLGSAEPSNMTRDATIASPWGTTSFAVSPLSLMTAYRVPDQPIEHNICAAMEADSKILVGPFKNEIGNAFISETPGLGLADTNENPGQSLITICEDDKPLGPPHSAHDDIRKLGTGRFSHWTGYLLFSTSDNSDPNSNGRRYTVVAADRQQ